MRIYWEVKIPLANEENQQVINEYLMYLKEIEKPESIINISRQQLQFFFKEEERPFTSIVNNDIKEWTTERKKTFKDATIVRYLSSLRSFFDYCIDRGYMKQHPIQDRWQKETKEKYWEIDRLPNSENQEVINDYLLSLKLANKSKRTIVCYRYFLNVYFKNRNQHFSSITSNDIQEWFMQHQKEHKETTIRFRLSVLSSFFSFCVEEGYLERTPIKKRWYPRMPKPIPKSLGKKEIAKIRNQSEKETLRNRVMFELFLDTGARVGEIEKLNRVDVNLENRTASVVGKGKKIRKVHFTEKCAVILERYLDSRLDDSPALFVSSIGQRIGVRQIEKIVNKVGNEAGIDSSLYPHRFRHTFATELLAKGAELSFISEELGHSEISTTQTYARLPKQEIVTLYRKYMG